MTDATTLADHDVQNDAVIYMCWKKESAGLLIVFFCFYFVKSLKQLCLLIFGFVMVDSDQWEELSVIKVEALDIGDGSSSMGGNGSGRNGGHTDS